MSQTRSTPRSLGRYVLYDEIAAGGMATVHIGRLFGPAGFSRTVAVKRLHAQFAKDPEFVSMFLDEARLAARIRHPNVVPTLDVVAEADELFLVMEFVQGLSLSKLVAGARAHDRAIPAHVASAIIGDTLLGLQAAHEAKDDRGEPLSIVHRDISPQNILVGTEGIARVVDFGVAKAASRAQTTREGKIKGKLAYMSPEQLRANAIDQRSDLFSAAIVLWELLTGKRLFAADDPAASVAAILTSDPEPPSVHAPALGKEADALVLRALARDPRARFTSAREMARALQAAIPRADSLEVAEWVALAGGDVLHAWNNRVALVEEVSARSCESNRYPALEPQSAAYPSGALGATVVIASPAAQLALPRPTPERRSEVTDLSSASAAIVERKPQWRALSLVLAGIPMALLALAASLPITGGWPRTAARSPSVPDSERELATVRMPAARAVPPTTGASPAAEQSASHATPPPPPSAPGTAPRVRGSTKKKMQASKAQRSSVDTVAAKNRAAAGCNPPYTLAVDGSKRFKPECF